MSDQPKPITALTIAKGIGATLFLIFAWCLCIAAVGLFCAVVRVLFNLGFNLL